MSQPDRSQPAATQPNHFETEVKLRPASLDDALIRIAAAGFQVHTPRALETNTLLDSADGGLRAAGQILRLREFAGVAFVTFKGPALKENGGGKHKVREEIETTVQSASSMRLLMSRLGFEPAFRYEKYRTVYVRPAEAGLLTVDETPIGPFLELEGDPAWIDNAAALLGYTPGAYITESYGQIWNRHCIARGLPPRDFVFVTDAPDKR